MVLEKVWKLFQGCTMFLMLNITIKSQYNSNYFMLTQLLKNKLKRLKVTDNSMLRYKVT